MNLTTILVSKVKGRLYSLSFISLLISMSSITSCTYKNEQDLYPINDCNTVNVSYKNFIAPIILDSCSNCHYDATMANGNYISLETYDEVSAQVKNLQLEVAMTAPPGSISAMPRSGGPLSQCNVQRILAWIKDGGPNN